MQVVRGIIGDFADNTSAHGFERVKNSGLIERITYIFVLLFLWALMLYLTTNIVKSYLAHESATSLTLEQKQSMELPALTICSLNPMKKSKLERFINETKNDLLVQLLLLTNEGSLSAIENQDQDNDVASIEHTLRENMSIAMYENTPKALAAFDNLLNESMLSFTYQGRNNAKNQFSIKEFLNPTYGNCFTIMPHPLRTRMPTLIPGNDMGLKLILFADDKETLGPIVPTTGMRVEVHPVNVAPIPEERGFSVSTGTLASIGIKRKQFDKSALSPFISCVKSDKNGPVEDSKGKFKTNFYDFIDNVDGVSNVTREYTKRACVKSCIVQKIYDDFKCVKASMITSEIAKKSAQLVDKTACQASGLEKINKNDDKLIQHCAHDDVCAAPCNYTEYDTNVVVNQFPSEQYIMVYCGEWMKDNPAFASSVLNEVSGLTGLTGSVSDLVGQLPILGNILGPIVGQLLEIPLIGGVSDVLSKVPGVDKVLGGVEKVIDVASVGLGLIGLGDMDAAKETAAKAVENAGAAIDKTKETIEKLPVVNSLTGIFGNKENVTSNEPLIGRKKRDSSMLSPPSSSCTMCPEDKNKTAAEAFIKKVQNSVLGVELFYEAMEMQVINESLQMNLVGLLSNMGGTFGLFIGISFVTLLEFVFFFIHLACCCPYKQDEAKDTEDKEFEGTQNEQD